MLDFLVYLFYRAVLGFVKALPFLALWRLGYFAGAFAWLCFGSYRRLVRRNLAIAFGGEQSIRELRRLERQHFAHLAVNLLSSVKMSLVPLEEVDRRVEFENMDLLHQPLRSGRGVVCILSHLGPMELFAHIFPRPHVVGYVRTADVYQKLRNPYIDAHLFRLRSRAGVEMFDRSQGFNPAIELLRGGGVIGIPSDQHSGDSGLWTPFFSRLASTTPLAPLLAKRADAVLVGVALYTVKPGRWRVVARAVVEPRGQSLEALTARINEITADQIRVAPADWFWVHNRWKTPRPNFLLPKYKRGVYLPADSILKPFRILIRSTNWLGDSVISAAAVRAIKRGRPDAHITIAAPAKIAPVWKLVPEVDEILPLPSRSLASTVSLLRKQRAFDVAILFPNSLRSALEIWLAGVPRRVGYRGHQRAWLLNQIVPDPKWRGPIRHQVHHYLHLAESVGADLALLPEPSVPRTSQASATIKIGLCPGAEYGPAKRWLPERFAEVAAALSKQHPSVQWILFGTAAEVEIGKPIADALGDLCVNRIGQTTIEELITELHDCRLLLTNDTGTMHLATLLGVPVVAIFGSTEDRLTGPLGEGHTVIRHHVECSPCFLRECPIDFRCMKAVTSEEVAAAVKRLL